MKMTVAKKIHSRKITTPGPVYNILGFVWKKFVAPKYNAHYIIKADPSRETEPYIFLSNHASRQDYIFTGIPNLPNRMNYVAGYNEFHRSHLALVFKLLKVIPKKNFTTDLYAMKAVTKVLRSGGRICLFPEGMSSISGANQPVVAGTGDLIKRRGVAVYYSVIRGGYLTCPKYNLRDRTGYVEVEVDKLFTPEDLKALTPSEIEDILNEKLYHDDYEWNLEKGHHYDIGDSGAENLEDLLFWCPRCGKQHTMKSEGNRFWCTSCGNGMTLLDTYEMVPFDKDSVIPKTQTAWFNMQRQVIKKEVQKEDFSLSARVKLGTLPDHKLLKNQKTSEISGEGTLTLDRSGLCFDGVRDGKPFSFHIESTHLPTYGMCTDVSRFYTFVNGEFVEFYPEERVVEKFFIATEELHRLNGGIWQDFKNR